MRDLLPETQAQALLEHRFAVLNVWKPSRGPVEKNPLAVCDAQTLCPPDFVPTDLRYRARSGEVYSLHFSEAHRWYYFLNMQADEALLLKCFDSALDRACFTAHTAFEDENSPSDAPARESIDVRTLAFFAPSA